MQPPKTERTAFELACAESVVIHIPFKKEALKDAIRFSHDNPPLGKGLGIYYDDAYKSFGIAG
jgi:hypothetical protein